MSDLFKEIIPSILVTGNDVLETEKDYVPFQVNVALSLHLDTILYSNQMNINNNLPKRLQYDYLINKVRHYKRPYKEWPKKYKPENLDIVSKYYEVSYSKAKEYLGVLSEDEIEELKIHLTEGGKL